METDKELLLLAARPGESNPSRQARAAMRYRFAYDYWFARMLSAAQNGEEFTDPRPRIEDFVPDTTPQLAEPLSVQQQH